MAGVSGTTKDGPATAGPSFFLGQKEAGTVSGARSAEGGSSSAGSSKRTPPEIDSQNYWGGAFSGPDSGASGFPFAMIANGISR